MPIRFIVPRVISTILVFWFIFLIGALLTSGPTVAPWLAMAFTITGWTFVVSALLLLVALVLWVIWS